MRAEKKPLDGIRESRNPRISVPSKSVVFAAPRPRLASAQKFPRRLTQPPPPPPAAPGCVLLSLSRRAVLISPSTIATPTDLTSRTHTTIVQPGTRQISLYKKCRPVSFECIHASGTPRRRGQKATSRHAGVLYDSWRFSALHSIRLGIHSMRLPVFRSQPTKGGGGRQGRVHYSDTAPSFSFSFRGFFASSSFSKQIVPGV